MSNSAANRARADLEKQLVELSRLRNANTRDPDFKVWRQATLTLIQRLWEGDDSRSARFRAIPFSPGAKTADVKVLRDSFERGCAEAARVLRALIEEINEHGIMKGPTVVTFESEEIPDDENVPILSLDPGERSGTLSIPDEPDDLRLSDEASEESLDEEEYEADEAEETDEIVDIPDPPGAREPKPVSRPAPRPARAEEPRAAKPAARAPASQAKPPAQEKPAAKRPAEPVIPLSETAPPGPARGVTVSSGKSAKKPVSKERLKDMLGFEGGAQYAAPARPAEPAQSAESAPPAAPARPAPTHTPRPAAPGARPAAPANREASPPQRPATPRRDAPAPPPDLERNEAFGTIAPESVAPLGEGIESHRYEPRPSAPQRPAPQAQRPAPPAPRAAEPPRPAGPPAGEPAEDAGMGAPRGYDETSLKRAFEAALQSFAERKREAEEDDSDEPGEPSEDLLGVSPVFSVTGGPVKRGGGESQGRYRTATGIAMAAIATEVEAMGVPGPECSLARAALLELADHFERRDLTWGTVRDALRLLVAYPVVARRVLPLLVPHLDEAA